MLSCCVLFLHRHKRELVSSDVIECEENTKEGPALVQHLYLVSLTNVQLCSSNSGDMDLINVLSALSVRVRVGRIGRRQQIQ